MPIGYLVPPAIPSNQLLVVESAPLHLFALLTSAMHMAWLRQVGGRLESRLRYSSGLVYNTFPGPRVGSGITRLESAARGVLEARAAHSGSKLADLYHRDLMPPNLRRAHAVLDRTVDRMYRRRGFGSDAERVEHLLSDYERRSAEIVTATTDWRHSDPQVSDQVEMARSGSGIPLARV